MNDKNELLDRVQELEAENAKLRYDTLTKLYGRSTSREESLKLRVQELEAENAKLREALSWGVGYINAGVAMGNVKRGQNAATDEMLDWIDRADAALAAAKDEAGK